MCLQICIWHCDDITAQKICISRPMYTLEAICGFFVYLLFFKLIGIICKCIPWTSHHSRCQNIQRFLYASLKNGRIMPWQCPSARPSVRPRFPNFSSTCFEISIWNLVYTFSRWHDMSSLSSITIGSLWPSLQPKVGQTHFLQSWPLKSR